jgi:hypothetical protein
VDETKFAGGVGGEGATVEGNLGKSADAHDGGFEIVSGDAKERGALFEKALEAAGAGLQFAKG